MFGLGDPALDVARLLQQTAQTLMPRQVEQWLDRYLQRIDDAGLAARIGVFRRLLAVHNVVLLLVGLQQHASGPIDDELRGALPYLQETLAAAFQHAAAALGITLPDHPAAAAQEFMTWLQAASLAAK